MPGNRFKVQELWDGVKKSTEDAWNGATQGTAAFLRQTFDLAKKYLPEVNLIYKIVVNLPGLIKSTLDLVRRFPRNLDQLKVFLDKVIGRIPGKIGSLINQATKSSLSTLRSILKSTEKSLRSGFSAAIKPLPKNIQDRIRSTLKPPIDAIRNSIKDSVRRIDKINGEIGKLKNFGTTQLNKAQSAIVKGTKSLLDKGFGAIDKKILATREYLFREYSKAQTKVTQSVSKVTGEVKSFTQVEFNRMSARMTTATTEVKAVGKNFTILRSAVEKEAIEIARMPQRIAEPIQRSKAEVIAALEKQFAKSTDAVLKPLRDAQRSIDDVGKSVSKIARFADDGGRLIIKLGDAITPLLKIAVNAAPIIDGFADYFQFEELNAKLDKIIEAVNRSDVNAQLQDIEIAAIKRILRSLPSVQGGQAVNLQPVLTKLDQIAATLKSSGTDRDTATIAQSVRDLRNDLASMPAQVAAKIPSSSATTTPSSVADAVVAKLPKQTPAKLDQAQLNEAIHQALKATPPGQTVSADAIADKVKAKLDPSLKTIDSKLPDNGIFRTDKAGIAQAVRNELNLKPITATIPKDTETAIGQIAKTVNSLPQLQTQSTATITQAIANAKPNIPKDLATTPQLDNLLGMVNNFTFNQSNRVIQNFQTIRVQMPSLPQVDLSPITKSLGDISKAIGVDELQKGITANPEDAIKKMGTELYQGGQIAPVKTLAGLLTATAVPLFYRQGLHRMGGDFDRSLMDPKQGKIKITDAMGFAQWQFTQIDQRMGMPTEIQIKDASGVTQTRKYQNIQDAIEEVSGTNAVALQDLEIIEHYAFKLTQDMQKLMQLVLQCRADIDVLIDDSGCKTKEVRMSHPTHLNLNNDKQGASLFRLFQGGTAHYVGRQWADSADKNQKLQRISYDGQIAAMSNKYELDKTAPELPLDKSKAATRPNNTDDVWKRFVSTMEEPPEGYVSPGNPIPKINVIKNGTPTNVPKPINPNDKLGK